MKNLTRRGFIAGLLATPVIVQAGNIWVPPRRLIRPDYPILWGDGIHDDFIAVQAMFDGKSVRRPCGEVVHSTLVSGRRVVNLPSGEYLIDKTGVGGVALDIHDKTDA